MKVVNNAFYEELGDAWYEEHKHPIALLRAENAARNPWIIRKIHEKLGTSQNILDIGCGAGFLSNSLALEGHQVTGIDVSASSLEIGKKRDRIQSVNYQQLNAFSLPFSPESFDAICAMDFLEHISDPQQIVQVVSRLLRPKGLFFFHTFNRNWLSYLFVIKGVEWCVPNTPAAMHLYSHFIKPSELRLWCKENALPIQEMHGLNPKFSSLAFWKSLFSRRVHPKLQFAMDSSLSLGYVGIAERL